MTGRAGPHAPRRTEHPREPPRRLDPASHRNHIGPKLRVKLIHPGVLTPAEVESFAPEFLGVPHGGKEHGHTRTSGGGRALLTSKRVDARAVFQHDKSARGQTGAVRSHGEAGKAPRCRRETLQEFFDPGGVVGQSLAGTSSLVQPSDFLPGSGVP